jgi:hypothetical protein
MKRNDGEAQVRRRRLGFVKGTHEFVLKMGLIVGKKNMEMKV